ncbi:hypothetical protein DBZ36_02245 [Alginatibacterium sediminis]|uniref:Uncharacterized protein n=1 Tax=Alginatibacterium sediminis TaxID=2164068 RepID=A0A420EL77_9ALTE|nr:hypothetical protein [Alginatibacterium sediminis]RKF21491.1 hypothetical protein DBZ36_02245 [Alginatibacterium sediminis]
MKLLSIPNYIDHDYLQAISVDYQAIVDNSTSAWADNSCLKSVNGQELMRLFLVTYKFWKKRHSTAPNAPSIGTGNQFDLFPLLCQIAFTLEELARFDISYNDQKLQLTLNTSVETLVEYLELYAELRIEIKNLELGSYAKQQAV